MDLKTSKNIEKYYIILLWDIVDALNLKDEKMMLRRVISAQKWLEGKKRPCGKGMEEFYESIKQGGISHGRRDNVKTEDI